MADTLFKETRYTVKQLVEMIDTGALALPDLQRPFVWGRSKVRDLFDSMYLGFPVGYLLLWNAGSAADSHEIGLEAKQKNATTFIIDGQQRLTSLYAVMKGKEIKNKKFEAETMTIAFRPRDGKFEVADAANKKDPEFLPDISLVWTDSEFGAGNSFIDRLLAAREKAASDDDGESDLLPNDEMVMLRQAISDLHSLEKFTFVANEVGVEAGDERVAEIFMRINSGGMKLNQADFILTLMSVHREDDRRRLEAFAEDSRTASADGVASPFNYLVSPGADQLLRTAVLNAFGRGRLSSVTALLRGASVDSGEGLAVAEREEQFNRLGVAIDNTLDLNDWHAFLKTIQVAGYFRSNEISSTNNIMFSYGFYLLGRHRYELTHGQLRSPLARFFFMSSLTGRYTGSFENQVSQDVRQLAEAASGDEFIALLDQIVATTLTEDFWTVSLPEGLRTSAARGPSLFAYAAALCLLDARLPFTAAGEPMRLRQMFQPGVSSPRAVERHHLFPRAYLEKIGITSQQQINQIANMGFVEWADNIEISDTPPAKYWPEYKGSFTEQDLADHALFEGWADCDYQDFLERRRALIAAAIRRGFATLDAAPSPAASID